MARLSHWWCDAAEEICGLDSDIHNCSESGLWWQRSIGDHWRFQLELTPDCAWQFWFLFKVQHGSQSCWWSKCKNYSETTGIGERVAVFIIGDKILLRVKRVTCYYWRPVVKGFTVYGGFISGRVYPCRSDIIIGVNYGSVSILKLTGVNTMFAA